MNIYVLDACALIAYLNDEPGADIVEALFNQEKRVAISMVNVYEVYYDAVKSMGEENAKSLLAEIEELPVKIVKNISKEIITEAAKFKVNYSMSLADSIALGLTKQLNACIVTSDHHEFDKIDEKRLITFHWIR
jgi:predicted nucleic acid-binding protein